MILTSIGTDGVHYGLGKHIWIVKIGLLIHGKKVQEKNKPTTLVVT